METLARASEIYDGLYSPDDVAELKATHPWAEAEWNTAITVQPMALRADLAVSRILIVMKDSRPRWIFFGGDTYDMRTVLSAPDVSQEVFTRLSALCQQSMSQ